MVASSVSSLDSLQSTDGASMTSTTGTALSKVPEVTLMFWIIKIAAFLGGLHSDPAAGGPWWGVSRQTSPRRGLDLSRYSASAALLLFIVAVILIFLQRAAKNTGH